MSLDYFQKHRRTKLSFTGKVYDQHQCQPLKFLVAHIGRIRSDIKKNHITFNIIITIAVVVYVTTARQN